MLLLTKHDGYERILDTDAGIVYEKSNLGKYVKLTSVHTSKLTIYADQGATDLWATLERHAARATEEEPLTYISPIYDFRGE